MEAASDSVAGLTRLRDHLRLAWQAHASAFYILEDLLSPPNRRQYLLRHDAAMFSPPAAAYQYLVATRNFARVALQVAKVLGHDALVKYQREFDQVLPSHKDARDILEHFEDYAVGTGRLQRAGRRLDGQPIAVGRHPKTGLTSIRIFDLEPIQPSLVSWWVDGWCHFTERAIFEHLHPDLEWGGWWPHEWPPIPPLELPEE